ncbi:MAG: hypothetical protein KIS29_09815 [Thermoplasmata archaeon]|nr:hypothetical protein [Candidatus Sysuiplasma jiujiangense]
MTEPLTPNEPLPDDSQYEVVKRNFLFPFGRRVRPRRRIPRISRKPGQNLKQYWAEILFEDGVIYILLFIGIVTGILAAVYLYFPEFFGIVILSTFISYAASAWTVAKISKDHVRTHIEVRMKDRPIRLRNTKDENGEIVADFISEDVTGIALYHYYDWQVGKTINFENVTGLHGDYGDITLGASSSPDGFTAIGQANYRENITTAMDYFQRVNALTKQQKKIRSLAKKGSISEADYSKIKVMEKFILRDIQERDSILAKAAPSLTPLSSLTKKEKQYVLGVRTANERALKELDEWESQPGSLRLLRLQRVLDNEVLLLARLEHYQAYQDQHDSKIRLEQHILEQDFRMNGQPDIAARLLDKKRLYKTTRTIYDLDLVSKAAGGDTDETGE